MSSSEAAMTRNVRVVVSPDRLSAIVQLPRDVATGPDLRDTILSALQALRIALDDSVLTRVYSLVQLIERGDSPPDDYLVAEGTPSQQGRDQEFVWDPSLRPGRIDPDSDEAADHHRFNAIVTVKEGMTVGFIKDAIPAVDGLDVYGEKIKHPKLPATIELDDTVERAGSDPTRIIAKVAGRAVFESGRLWVDDLLEIRGDVDFETGNIESGIDVSITGTVRDRFEVNCKHTISIGGAIEAATVHAGGNLTVRGGIVNRNRGEVTTDGDVAAKFCDEARIRAKGDIRVAKEIINCDIHAEGRVVAERGAVIGGCVYAREGIEAGRLGSDANVYTNVCVGIHPSVLRDAEQIKTRIRSRQRRLETVRRRMEPLLREARRLRREQNQEATALLLRSIETERQIKGEQQRRADLISAGRAQNVPSIRVNKVLCQDVTIWIGKRAATIHSEIRGPVVIEKRKVEGHSEMVAVSQLTGEVMILPSEKLPPPVDLFHGLDHGSDDAAPAAGEEARVRAI